MNNKIKFTVLAILMFVYAANAQDWNWGSNEKRARSEWQNVQSSSDSKQYMNALNSAGWLLKNAPQLNESLYILSSKIYEEAVTEVKDEKRQRELMDTALYIYDKRLELYGGEANILDRKGKIAYLYNYNESDKKYELYDLYKKIYDLNKSDMHYKSGYYYMGATRMQYQAKKISEDDVINVFFAMSDFYDEQIKNTDKEKYVSIYEKYKDKVLKEFEKSGAQLDCDKVKSVFGPKYTSAPNLDMAKDINERMRTAGCTTDDLYIKTLEHIINEEPSFVQYKRLAKSYTELKEMDKAYVALDSAASLAENVDEKADLYYNMALIQKGKGGLAAARRDARKAIAVNGHPASHTLIGDMYFSSAGSCNPSDVVKMRAVYIAAYNEYNQAGNSSKMQQARAQFPSMEEIFTQNKNVGDVVNTGCWIGESVTLQKR